MARADAEAYLVKFLKDLTHDEYNSKVYQAKMASMSDKAFKQYLEDLVSGKDKISVTIPNYGKSKLDTKNNLKLAKQLNLNLFKSLKIGNPYTDMVFTTPNKYMIVDIPVRRVAQRQEDKISVAKHSKTTDLLTKQPVGDSASRSLSLVEAQILKSLGLDATVEELDKVRGGDEGAYSAMLSLLNSQDGVTLEELRKYATGVQSKKYVKALLQAQHIGNTL